jgi:hypothetical protein
MLFKYSVSTLWQKNLNEIRTTNNEIRIMSKDAAAKKFFEIVNWDKAQPRMTGENNPWFKQYTSILHNEQYCKLDDASRVLITHLWAYAAVTGNKVLPADPDWLYRKIPSLNSRPNLQPLFEASDLYGNPKPFIRYCDPKTVLAADKAEAAQAEPLKDEGCETMVDGRATAQHPESMKGLKGEKGGKNTKTQKRAEQNRVEQSRVEERTADETLTGFGKRKEEEKITGYSTTTREDQAEQSKSEQSTGQQVEQPQTLSPQTTPEPATSPQNPTESEVGAVKAFHLPRPPHSVLRHPERLGDIISGRLPNHWQDGEAEAFGWQIVGALGLTVDPNNLQARSEWGSFASWWCRVKEATGGQLGGELRDIAIKKANFVKVKAKTARNKSAVWFKIMAGELASRGIRLPDVRASPRKYG